MQASTVTSHTKQKEIVIPASTFSLCFSLTQWRDLSSTFANAGTSSGINTIRVATEESVNENGHFENGIIPKRQQQFQNDANIIKAAKIILFLLMDMILPSANPDLLEQLYHSHSGWSNTHAKRQPHVCVNQSLAEIKPMPSGNSITASTHRKEGS